MSAAVAATVVWIWLGMVLAISFLESPLNVRARGVDLRTRLAIDRLVFRVLTTIETLVASALLLLLAIAGPGLLAATAGVVAVVVLAAQLAGVRPALVRRSDRVIAGEDGPRSHAHLWYVGLQVVKVAALVVTGVALF